MRSLAPEARRRERAGKEVARNTRICAMSDPLYVRAMRLRIQFSAQGISPAARLLVSSKSLAGGGEGRKGYGDNEKWGGGEREILGDWELQLNINRAAKPILSESLGS